RSAAQILPTGARRPARYGLRALRSPSTSADPRSRRARNAPSYRPAGPASPRGPRGGLLPWGVRVVGAGVDRVGRAPPRRHAAPPDGEAEERYLPPHPRGPL